MIANIDRVPVNVATNGAIRQGVYDVNGNLIRYEYVMREDDATVVGTPMNKAKLDEILAATGTTAGTSDALTLAQAGFVLLDGATVRFKLHTDMNKGATLNVSGTGAKTVLDGRKKRQKAFAGAWCTVTYSGTDGNFILQGSGGDAGLFGNDPGQVSANQFIELGHKALIGGI